MNFTKNYNIVKSETNQVFKRTIVFQDIRIQSSKEQIIIFYLDSIEASRHG
jgi:hypothetical protein